MCSPRLAYLQPGHSCSRSSSKRVTSHELIVRCLTIICRTVATTSALEDRRLRRDVQDVYLKVLDGVVSSASRLGEGAMWERDPSPSRQAQLDNEGEKAGILDKDLGVAKVSRKLTLTDARSKLSWPIGLFPICGHSWVMQRR